MVVQYIAMRPILYLCEVAERKRGEQVGMRWWEQSRIEMTGARETSATETEAENDGMENYRRGI